jgi:hypothetical protein
MPADFVFVNRLQWGMWSILSTLEATRNWHRIHDDPPSTELGKLDRDYRVGRFLAEDRRVE